VAVVLKRIHQLRQQGMEPFAAQPITGFPERHQRLNHLGAVTAAVLAALAALPLIGLLVQPAQERFAVIAGERLQLIQQQLFPRTAQAPVTRCCRA
jgi:hypothetical protein